MKQKAKPVISDFKVSNKFLKVIQNSLNKLALVLAVVVVVVIAIVVVNATHKSKQPQKVVAVNVCSKQLLSRAAPLLRAQTATAENELQPLVTQIQSLKNYQQDPNCLYVLINYNLGLSYYNSSQTYLNDLEKVYNPKQGFSSVFTDPISVATLKVDVATLNTANQEANKNGVGIPPKDTEK